MSDTLPTPANDWVRFERAAPQDAAALTAVQVRTFNDDTRRFAGQAAGGPPGYDSVRWQVKMMNYGDYYKILHGENIIGGIIVYRMGAVHYEVGRIWIDPEYQNRGIGSLALRFIEDSFPAVQRWTLDSPAWAVRSQHFYQKAGYRKTGERHSPDDGSLQYIYEKMP